jgi:hypothetical protein
VDRPFRTEEDFRRHIELDASISVWLESVLLKVCPWWKEAYSVGEWWEDENHPGRLIVNYDTHSGCESWDNQTETALAILWCDDPQSAHDKVLEELAQERAARKREAAKAVRYYTTVRDTEEAERECLRKLAEKYPDELPRSRVSDAPSHHSP